MLGFCTVTHAKTPDYLPEVRAAARQAFIERYPDVSFAPIVVVIAAYNEEESLGEVLRAMPATVGGLRVDTIVVNDGSSDGTEKVALDHPNVYVASLARNCGQGAALRLGYELARDHGATYLVTLDADMQWDPAEIPDVIEPLLHDEADFVLGSRTLGIGENPDRLRKYGVGFFRLLIRLLTGVPVTDTSSGLRAMRAEVTAKVPQVQAQYQASELLIGTIYAGYRIAERPVTMRKRFAGESKKGHNVIYGLRYGRVILSTWWRQSRRAGRPGRRARR
jgi:glycosyltransferase involved in cell wall biosynthesis